MKLLRDIEGPLSFLVANDSYIAGRHALPTAMGVQSIQKEHQMP